MNITTKELKELFSQFGFNVMDIDILDDVGNVYVEINPVGIYSIEEIEKVIKKIKDIKEKLVKEGLILDIKLGDLYRGSLLIKVDIKS